MFKTPKPKFVRKWRPVKFVPWSPGDEVDGLVCEITGECKTEGAFNQAHVVWPAGTTQDDINALPAGRRRWIQPPEIGGPARRHLLDFD